EQAIGPAMAEDAEPRQAGREVACVPELAPQPLTAARSLELAEHVQRLLIAGAVAKPLKPRRERAVPAPTGAVAVLEGGVEASRRRHRGSQVEGGGGRIEVVFPGRTVPGKALE